MRIIPYAEEWFEPVVAMLRTNWADSHPLYDQRLFDWQYRIANCPASLVAFDGDEVVGFLGAIPGTYRVHGRRVQGVGLSMWCVAERLRNSGLGVLLLRQAERRFPVTLTLGAGPQTLDMYRRMGYTILERLHRYVLPIHEPGFRALCRPHEYTALDPESSRVPTPGPAAAETAARPTAEDLAMLYERSVAPAFAFSQDRDAEFWQWRYLDSPGFRYHVLGDCDAQGAAVVRMERVVAADHPDLQQLRVLRILELIPADPRVWHGQPHAAFSRLLIDVVEWGAASGCVAADFQCTHRRLSAGLAQAGFLEQAGPTDAPLAPLFQPLRWHANPLNFLWRISPDLASGPVDAEQTYFVKSDCDMDRPVMWPLPEDP
jgi:GNAT superfamily N-acetyltransferase